MLQRAQRGCGSGSPNQVLSMARLCPWPCPLRPEAAQGWGGACLGPRPSPGGSSPRKVAGTPTFPLLPCGGHMVRAEGIEGRQGLLKLMAWKISSRGQKTPKAQQGWGTKKTAPGSGPRSTQLRGNLQPCIRGGRVCSDDLCCHPLTNIHLQSCFLAWLGLLSGPLHGQLVGVRPYRPAHYAGTASWPMWPQPSDTIRSK